MRILVLAFWLGFHSLATGQQELEKAPLTATNVVFQSVDGGQTWQDVSAGLPEDVAVRLFFAGDGAVYLGSQKDGLYRSRTTSATPIWENQLFLPEHINGIFPGRAGPYACCLRERCCCGNTGHGWVDTRIHELKRPERTHAFGNPGRQRFRRLRERHLPIR